MPALVALLGMTLATSQAEGAPGAACAHIVEQPTGIELQDYVGAWPDLEPFVARLRQSDPTSVTSDLRRLAASPRPSDGALNLLAQLDREGSKLDDAEASIAAAIASNPSQDLHHFQQAMIFYARLSRATGPLERWKWHRKTRDAYQRAFQLDPRPVPYRYYFVYTYLQSPRIAGGDVDQALRMAQEAVDNGQVEFYVVRADVHRVREELAAGFADYDKAIEAGVFKLSSFLAAGRAALENQDQRRAKAYLEWAVSCRPDSPRTHEGLGDYYAAVGDAGAAVAAYEAALRADPGHAPSRGKLEKARKAP